MDDEHLQYPNSDEEFQRFLNEIDGSSERGAVLSSLCMVELMLERCVDAWLSNGPPEPAKRLKRREGPLGTLSARLDLLVCIGVLSKDEFDALNLARKIRNDFAHDLMASFMDSAIADRSYALCNLMLGGLSSKQTLERLIDSGAHKAFCASLFVLVDRLKLRPVLISSMADALKHDFSIMNDEIMDIVEHSAQ